MPDARCTRSLVCAMVASMHTSIHSEPPESPGIPARNGFTAYTVLSPAIGFLVTVALRKMARAPGRAQHTSANLTPASRRQDHTISPSASAPFVSMPLIAHSRSPPCDHVSCLTLPRPPQPAPTFVTMANAPLSGRDGGGYRLIWVFGKTEYFCKGGWTGFRDGSPSGKSLADQAGCARVHHSCHRPA